MTFSSWLWLLLYSVVIILGTVISRRLEKPELVEYGSIVVAGTGFGCTVGMLASAGKLCKETKDTPGRQHETQSHQLLGGIAIISILYPLLYTLVFTMVEYFRHRKPIAGGGWLQRALLAGAVGTSELNPAVAQDPAEPSGLMKRPSYTDALLNDYFSFDRSPEPSEPPDGNVVRTTHGEECAETSLWLGETGEVERDHRSEAINTGWCQVKGNPNRIDTVPRTYENHKVSTELRKKFVEEQGVRINEAAARYSAAAAAAASIAAAVGSTDDLTAEQVSSLVPKDQEFPTDVKGLYYNKVKTQFGLPLNVPNALDELQDMTDNAEKLANEAEQNLQTLEDAVLKDAVDDRIDVQEVVEQEAAPVEESGAWPVEKATLEAKVKAEAEAVKAEAEAVKAREEAEKAREEAILERNLDTLGQRRGLRIRQLREEGMTQGRDATTEISGDIVCSDKGNCKEFTESLSLNNPYFASVYAAILKLKTVAGFALASSPVSSEVAFATVSWVIGVALEDKAEPVINALATKYKQNDHKLLWVTLAVMTVAVISAITIAGPSLSSLVGPSVSPAVETVMHSVANAFQPLMIGGFGKTVSRRVIPALMGNQEKELNIDLLSFSSQIKANTEVLNQMTRPNGTIEFRVMEIFQWARKKWSVETTTEDNLHYTIAFVVAVHLALLPEKTAKLYFAQPLSLPDSDVIDKTITLDLTNAFAIAFLKKKIETTIGMASWVSRDGLPELVSDTVDELVKIRLRDYLVDTSLVPGSMQERANKVMTENFSTLWPANANQMERDHRTTTISLCARIFNRWTHPWAFFAPPVPHTENQLKTQVKSITKSLKIGEHREQLQRVIRRISGAENMSVVAKGDSKEEAMNTLTKFVGNEHATRLLEQYGTSDPVLSEITASQINTWVTVYES